MLGRADNTSVTAAAVLLARIRPQANSRLPPSRLDIQFDRMYHVGVRLANGCGLVNRIERDTVSCCRSSSS